MKWCLIRYLQLSDRNPARITKADKGLAKRLDFNDKNFPVKTSDIYKVEKNFIKDFNTFMYNDTLHRGRKHLCRYCLQVFRTAEKLKYLIKDWFKING